MVFVSWTELRKFVASCDLVNVDLGLVSERKENMIKNNIPRVTKITTNINPTTSSCPLREDFDIEHPKTKTLILR